MIVHHGFGMMHDCVCGLFMTMGLVTESVGADTDPSPFSCEIGNTFLTLSQVGLLGQIAHFKKNRGCANMPCKNHTVNTLKKWYWSFQQCVSHVLDWGGQFQSHEPKPLMALEGISKRPEAEKLNTEEWSKEPVTQELCPLSSAAPSRLKPGTVWVGVLPCLGVLAPYHLTWHDPSDEPDYVCYINSVCLSLRAVGKLLSQEQVSKVEKWNSQTDTERMDSSSNNRTGVHPPSRPQYWLEGQMERCIYENNSVILVHFMVIN